MNKQSSFVPFVVGVVLGVLAAVYLPGYVRPYLPDWLAGKVTIVTGAVTAKQRKDKALLLTVNTPQGAVLVTITKKVDEVGLLVNEGNTIEFALKTYSPFVEDPKISRVIKGEPSASPEPAKAAAPPAAPLPKPAEKGPRDVKPQRPASPASAGTSTKTVPVTRPATTK